LSMTVSQAREFFADQPVITAPCQNLEQVGLGYLQLGQPLDTLSGGETERLTLAVQLEEPRQGEFLYLFDEPSTGLHFTDIDILLDLFDQLVDRGHSILMVEHDPQMIGHCDWIIDLGPGAGDRGGQLVGQGRVSDLMRNSDSATGRVLEESL
jgi:excinuclease ABC subunit A